MKSIILHKKETRSTHVKKIEAAKNKEITNANYGREYFILLEGIIP
jgi:hypothetical protein